MQTRSRLGFLLDWGERLLVLGLYGWLVVRMVNNYLAGGQLASLILLPSEGLVVLFLLIRRPAAEISTRPGDWLLALGATCLPQLVIPGGAEPLVPVTVAAFLLIAGLLIRLLAKLSLNRSFGAVPANRGVKVSGAYRYVRHPMYLGYLISHIGFLLANPLWWNLALYAVELGLQVFRLLAEERLLSQDPRYRDYQAAVRYRLIPGLF